MVSSCYLRKTPKTKLFSGHTSRPNRTNRSANTFFYPDYNRRLRSSTGSCVVTALRQAQSGHGARGLYHRSGIHLHCVAFPAMQVSPCPEGSYSDVLVLIIMHSYLHFKSRIATGRLCLYDALDRADRRALRFVVMAYALDTGIGVDNV